uniref:Uncharacterized protein n=1 Tax=Anguilla anguilla TaxID=7936 RepID=A0A0E9SLT6_ANGAN
MLKSEYIENDSITLMQYCGSWNFDES